ncbi:sulfotransferase family protein [Puniceibacterium confluentis]|uniref:sulfotransferase family protein n=1 Tax=Puniceibacterium confluentis TaxID=1958944 RepID=UPI0011B6D2E5|nr:sulfotransferase family protein [Puniceibacterium confluentis]
MPEKTFVLGLGASKSGTTWIQTYLHRAEGVDMGRLGEYQVWDALHLPENSRYRIARPGLVQRLEAALAVRVGLPVKGPVFRYGLQQNPARYFEYFQHRLAQPGIRVTGDISPGYAGLPVSVLQMIDSTFATRGIAVKPLFVMRDPIERAWSIVKMRRRKGRSGGDGDTSAESDFREAVRAGFGVSYETSLRNIDAAFGPGRAYLGLFETMFTPEAVQRLSDFAGIHSNPAASRQRVNDSGDRSGVAPALARDVFDTFAADYAYCLARFPEARTAWPHAHLSG